MQLQPADLGLAVNSVESALASQSSSSPALNMLVYIPPVQRYPLTVAGSVLNSFLIPRWGGVHLYNYAGPEADNVRFPMQLELDMGRVAGVWLTQLRSLLGVTELTREQPALPLPPAGTRLWERDFQLRYRSDL